LIQKILEKGGEVLILEDPIDEFCLQNLGEYEKKKLKNVAKGEFKLWEDDDDELIKKKEKKIEKDFKPLIEWWKKLLGAKVENIIVSQRLVDSPCIVVGNEHGYSASMERIQKAQAFNSNDKITSQFLYARKTMEINPNHPSIKSLKEQVGSSDKVSEDVEDTAMLLFENALLESGYSLPDPHAFGLRMEKVLKYNLGLSRDEKVSPYEVVLDDKDDDDEEEEEEGSLKKIILVAIIFIAALLLDKLPFFSFNGPIAKGRENIFLAIRAVYLALYALAYIKCGREVLHGMIRNMAKGNFFTEETLMGVSTIGALILGEYSEAVAVMLLFNLGEFLEDKAVDSAKHSITKLVSIRADKACVIRNGKEETVDAADVGIGETIIVRPGERVPLDGKIVQGTTLADTSALTGESVPRELLQGDDILSGFISTSGQVQVEVTKVLGESSASRIIQMVKDAQKKKSHTQKFVSRIAKVYTPFVCALALLVAIVPPLASFFVTGINSSAIWKLWVYRALELLVVSCPCALVISVPLTFFAGIGRAGKSGILIKGANYLEQLSKAKTVVFDK
ncbi:MAG: HAD-IC family P-type ATPase, partial [Lachnospiraceae bacterium]|nr:HAD-IC family P-type ATPase [Lachnospiraceae bacterium]